MPPVGGRVTTPPSELHLYYTEGVVPHFSSVEVLSPSGQKISYQPPYPVTGFAQARLVMEAMRSGICMSLFHALWQASRIAS